VEAKDKGSVAIPARLLLDTLKAFPEQPLTFSIDGKHHGVEINSEQGKYKMTGFSGAEFPKSPVLEEQPSCHPARRHPAEGHQQDHFRHRATTTCAR
jgi:DNA polymerase III sliding clamp (beta) subunit (PCNA family)